MICQRQEDLISLIKGKKRLSKKRWKVIGSWPKDICRDPKLNKVHATSRTISNVITRDELKARTSQAKLFPPEVREKRIQFAEKYVYQSTNQISLGIMTNKRAAAEWADKQNRRTSFLWRYSTFLKFANSIGINVTL